MKDISIIINGALINASVEPRMSLADFLRTSQRLTGTHLGCEHGVCGACTVLINGAPGRSCIAFAVALDGAEIRTVEGFEDDHVMSAVRHAFHVEHGLQCGFCTAGMLITARDMVTRFSAADESRIRRELSGNLCRCTGYMGIVNAVQRVLREMPADQRVKHEMARAAAVAAPAFEPFVLFEPAAEKPTDPVQKASAARSGDEHDLPEGWARLMDSFRVAKSRSETWGVFSDLQRMAACMPGALLEEIDDHQLKGQMRIAFGPIRAGFSGAATIERDDENFIGVLAGGGSDLASGSRAKGQVIYRLRSTDRDDQTVVDLTLDYQLQGALAQFGRSGLVKDFASRLIATFAKNLADELESRPRSGGKRQAELRVTDLIWSVVVSRVKRLLTRLSR